MVSVLTGIPVRADVAMTGEITLRGEVLPIGGLKEKLLAAHRGGIKTVLIPEENVKDLAEIPDKIKNRLDIHPVRWIDQVLEWRSSASRTPLPDEKPKPCHPSAPKCRQADVASSVKHAREARRFQRNADLRAQCAAIRRMRKVASCDLTCRRTMSCRSQHIGRIARNSCLTPRLRACYKASAGIHPARVDERATRSQSAVPRSMRQF